MQGFANGEEDIGVEAIRNPLLTALSTEGSFSDSGISDSGSEHELSEREKRLAQLKRLAKRLESILAPSSQALSNMFKVSTSLIRCGQKRFVMLKQKKMYFQRIEEAENELRELQQTCKDIILRSVSGEELKMIMCKTSEAGALDEVDDSRVSVKHSPG